MVRIAVPCPMKWSQMEGDGRARHCGQCNQTVFNFAELDAEEARLLLRKHAEGGRICARLFVRADGTMMTKDCPVGYRYGLQLARRFAVPALVLPVLAIAFWMVSVVTDNYRRLRSMTGQLEVTPAAVARTR